VKERTKRIILVGFAMGGKEQSIVARLYSCKPRLHFMIIVCSNIAVQKLFTELYKGD